MNMQSTLCGDFSRVKTRMGLDRFEVRSPFRPILKSVWNWFWGKIDLSSFFPAQELTYIKIWLSTLKELPIGNHLPKRHNLCQNPYGLRTMLKFNLERFFLLPKSGSENCFKFTSNQGGANWVITTCSCWVKSLMGVIFSPSCRPPSFLIVKKKKGKFNKKVSSIWLKIAMWVAYG